MRRLLAVLLLVTLAACTSSKDSGEVVNYEPGKRVAAPEVKGELLDGGTYDLSAHKGKVVVVNFWASWCGPCRVETDDLEAVRKALAEVEFVGINVRDERDKAIAFVEGRVGYPSIFDPAGRLALAFSQVPPNTIPATLIIDREGRIAVVIRKAIKQEELTRLTSAVLAEGST